MDELIKAVFNLLQVEEMTVEAIHDAIIDNGWSEEDAYLAIKAGQNLYDAIIKQEEELKKRPLPFGRKQ